MSIKFTGTERDALLELLTMSARYGNAGQLNFARDASCILDAAKARQSDETLTPNYDRFIDELKTERAAEYEPSDAEVEAALHAFHNIATRGGSNAWMRAALKAAHAARGTT